mgnify:CR=1 FL=1
MKLICKTVFGSHLYGTATPTSDNDVRGIFLPSKNEILLGRVPRTNKDNGNSTEDFELYSIHHFVKLACEGQTLAFDMLWTPTHQVERGEAGHVWDELCALRHKFLSKRMSAFVGYARGQAAKYSLKGERLAKLETFLGMLKPAYGDFLLADYFEQLPKDDERTNAQGVKELQIAGKWYGERTQVRYVRESLQGVIDGYGQRANASKAGVDWKAMSHAVRVSLELQDLLTEGQIKFPLHYAEGLLRIKRGEQSLSFVQDYLDEVLENVNKLIDRSSLPDKVDRVFWDDWLADCVGREMV